MSSIENFRNRIEESLTKQISLQGSMDMDQSGTQTIIDSLRSGELIVSVAGEINRGKSTFLNALMGIKIFPSRATVCTAGVTVLDNGKSPLAEVVYKNGKKENIELDDNEPGKTLANYISRTNKNVKDINSLNIKYPNKFSGNGILLVDTPGVNDPENWREEITYNYMSASDAVIMLLDPVQPLSASEVEFLKNKILDSCIEKLIFVVNKIDDIPINDRQSVLDRIQKGLSKHVTNPNIFSVSSKRALNAKLNDNNDLYISSGFKKFEEYLLQFLLKGRGGALLDTKINKGLNISDDIQENINNRLGALELEKDVVKKKLNDAKKGLSSFENKKKELQKNIKTEEKEIVSKLKTVILNRKRYFDNTLKKMILNEPQLTSLRTNVLDFQKETVTLFTDKINDINKRLIAKYQTQAIKMISDIKQLLSSLGKQAVLSTKGLRVDKKERSLEINQDNSEVKSGATIGGIVGASTGALAAANATVVYAGALWTFTSLGVAVMGALSGGLGLLAGAGIAAYLKKQKKEKAQDHYIETTAIVDNSKACDAVANFLKGMERQSVVAGGMILKSFIDQAITPIDKQISDQNNLIDNIKNDLAKTQNDQKSTKTELLDNNNKLNTINNDYNSIRSDIQAI